MVLCYIKFIQPKQWGYSGDSGPGCSAHAEGCDGSTGIRFYLKKKKRKIQKILIQNIRKSKLLQQTSNPLLKFSSFFFNLIISLFNLK